MRALQRRRAAHARAPHRLQAADHALHSPGGRRGVAQLAQALPLDLLHQQLLDAVLGLQLGRALRLRGVLVQQVGPARLGRLLPGQRDVRRGLEGLWQLGELLL